MGRFTKVSEDAFDAMQLEAGVILSDFDPTNPVEPDSEDIIAVTTGGIAVACEAEYEDYGADVDNVPNNMMEFKKITGWNCTMGFSDLKFNAANTKLELGAADITNGTGFKKIVPRRDLQLTDFTDAIWWVGDKANGGAYAVKLMHALSNGGLSIQSTKNGKGQNAVTLMGHVSIQAQNVVPMEFYELDPVAEPGTGTGTGTGN